MLPSGARVTGTVVHSVFDALAWLAAGLAALLLARSGRVQFPVLAPARSGYFVTLILGSGIGAVALGTANLALSGQPGVGRSIEGALAGAIVAVELYKRLAGVTERTGARFALPLALGIAIGRIGCFLSGIDDFTHGTPTALPWAHDFGDGVLRHPVQLYESAAMTLFAAIYVARLRAGDRFWIDHGFYLAVGFYGAQRFCWEFWKPYGTIIGPLTLFHLVSLGLFAYALVMIATAPRHAAGITHEHLPGLGTRP